MRFMTVLLALGLAVASSGAFATPLSVDLRASPDNPPSPQMGDNLAFQSVIRNDGAAPAAGVIAWISLVQINKGNEQPVDLEDWSAHKAITAASLAGGQSIATDWPMRLIQAGRYRVVVSTMTRDGSALAASPFVDFSVRQKPVVESQRVLPVALGIPAILGTMLLWRWRRA